VIEHGQNNHETIAAAFTHEANQVAADMTRQLWPKFARHIKEFQRKREQQHLTKKQGLTRSAFHFTTKLTVSREPTWNHSKVLKLS